MQPQEFDSRFCAKLNTQQLQAVHCVDGPVLLLAVPGSGKTTVLVTRLGYMVYCCDIDPRRILTMTYTVAATQEMRQRFARSFGERYASDMEFCTINSLATQIISFYVRRHGSGQAFPLIENDAAVRLVAGIYQDISNDYATDSVIKDIRTGISYIKNMMLGTDEIEKIDLGVEEMGKIYRAYSSALKQNGLMDFDDQLSYALTILRRFPDVLEHFQDRFPYICVDESQDTSKIQHEIIKLMAKKYGNIFMVGDEDQSIYGFRAAFPEALLSFEKEHPGAKVLLMEQNYRSQKEIVTAADMFISKNEHRHPKRMQAARESGRQIQLVDVDSRSMQYTWLFEVGRKCTADTAILYRNNDSALPLIDMFERCGVAYNCKKFEDSFFTHRVVTDIRDIISFAYEPRNAELFMRIFYKFGSPISRKAAQYACDDSIRSGRSILDELVVSPELNSYGKETSANLCDILSNLPKDSAEAAIVHIWKTLKYSSYVAMNGLDAGKFDILCQLARREKSPMDLLRRLDELRLLTQNHVNSPENRLTLSTIHSSKGLEYERVYLLDMFDGILPSKRKAELHEEGDFRQYEEDRRIYYVGMTRAKDELYLFSCADKPSEFNREIAAFLPDEHVDENDVFSSMKTKLCGKSYTHAQYGKGVVKAQCGDNLLVYWPDREPKLMTLAQMMAQRDMSIKYSEAKKALLVKAEPEPEIKVGIGTKLKHKVFGPGVVLAVKNDTASILFSKEYGTKRIVISTSFKNGILSIQE